MTTRSNVEDRGLLNVIIFSPSFDSFLNLLSRTLFATLLIGLVWLPGLSMSSAMAAPINAGEQAERIISQVVEPVEGDRMSSLITCLPKQLSQPDLKRTLSEMGNDQIERILSLKSNPKLSQAETELKDCLSLKGFTN
ncbi:MAG: hypothetical protein HC840_08440 [Leptolyngbyaceae cyanobacterium RM2_2_4]|nr:hypothetical protein [Leptolyngbyaceae cyanobacterium RM2_2_4]